MSAANNGASTEPSKLLVSKFQQISQVSDPDGKLRLVLASQSPRRTEILEMMGLAGRFTASPSPLDEEKLQVELSQREITPPDYARILAERKAHAYGASVDSTNESVTLIVGSDTIVDFDGHIMNKPANAEDANRMLSMLSGNWHQVHTGVAVYAVDTMKPDSTEPKLMFSFTDTARVKFSSLTETDIKAYIETKEPFDKAGSYGIQGIGGQLVERIEGDFFTVMGLPMHRLSRELTDALN
jgi:septum formation protein